MTYEAKTPEEYIAQLPEDRKEAVRRLRQVINDNIPKGYEECISYGMIGWVVPKSTYPDGYHCDPSLPLPFMNLASQKRHIAVYHSGIYADTELMAWFKEEFGKVITTKLNMGKSCIRFTNLKKIPYELIGELVSKISPQQWIEIYESNVKR